MVRTQIQLDDKVAERLPDLAKARGQSVAAFIREAVDARIAELDRERQAAWARALAAMEHAASDIEGATDVAENHDKYWADDIYERKVLGIKRWPKQ
jgi:predicted DNA-binding protein